MRTLWTLAGVGSGLGICLLASGGCGKADAAPREPLRSTAVDLTVYEDDFALIHERRPVTLEAGPNQVRLDKVSKQLDPNTVTFDPGEGAQVIATTYDLGVRSGQGLIQRLAGKPVELIWSSNNGHEGDRLKGILEPTPDGFLIRSGDKIYLNPAGTLVAPADGDVDSMPGLSVQLSSDKRSNQDLGMTYLTRGLSWSADYVAHLDPATSTMRLECWASVTNGTGIPYHNANITFVAGSPNRAVRVGWLDQELAKPANTAYSAAVDAPKETGTVRLEPRSVGELYEYKSAGPATIGVDQMSRVRMLEAKTIPVRFDYSVRLGGISPWQGSGQQGRVGAQLALKFENKTTSGLGVPLPSGGVRVFESDSDKDRFTGADTISDVPKDSPIQLTLTKVFDVYAEPPVVKSQRVDKHTVRQTLRIALHNAKATAVPLRIVEGMSDARWKYVSGDKPEKLDATTTQWKVMIPANSDKTIEVTFDQKV